MGNCAVPLRNRYNSPVYKFSVGSNLSGPLTATEPGSNAGSFNIIIINCHVEVYGLFICRVSLIFTPV